MPEKLVPLNEVRSERFKFEMELPLPVEEGRVLAIRQDVLEDLLEFAGVEHLEIGPERRVDNSERKAATMETVRKDREIAVYLKGEKEPRLILNRPYFKIARQFREGFEIEKGAFHSRVSDLEGGMHSLDNFAEALNQIFLIILRKLGRNIFGSLEKNDVLSNSILCLFMLPMGLNNVLLAQFIANLLELITSWFKYGKRTRFSIVRIGGLELDRLAIWETMMFNTRIFEVMGVEEDEGPDEIVTVKTS